MYRKMTDLLERANAVIGQGELFARLLYSDTPGRDALLKAIAGYRSDFYKVMKPEVLNPKGDSNA